MSAVYQGTTSGIVLSNGFTTKNPVTIATDGIVSGNTAGSHGAALYASGYAWTIANAGILSATGSKSNGVSLEAGGSFINGASSATAALVSGVYTGIAVYGAPAIVTNYGTVQGTGTAFQPSGYISGLGIYLGAGGVLTNGSSESPSAVIEGYTTAISVQNVAATIVNFGRMQNTAFGDTIYLGAGATGTTIVNHSTGLITGRSAIDTSPTTASSGAVVVFNYGTISNTDSTVSDIYLGHGGLVTNGAAGNTVATVNGPGKGIVIAGAAGSIANFGQIDSGTDGAANIDAGGQIRNFGTIVNTSTAHSAVYFANGGIFTNGSTGDTTALVASPKNGVGIVGSAGSVVNFGTILSTTTGISGDAIYFGAGGTVTNYGLLSGNRAPNGSTNGAVVAAQNQPTTVRNFGTIETTNPGLGVQISFGGTIVNGASNFTGALVTGSADGIYIGGQLGVHNAGAQAFVYNYGTISHTGTSGAAIKAVSGGTVVNNGLITSLRTGIGFFYSTGTVTNLGTVTAINAARGKVGVYLGVGGELVNQAGAIIASTRYGVALGAAAVTGLPNYSASGLVNNSGVLAGAIGVYVGTDDLGTNTIINTGTIQGTGGIAIRLGTVGNQLIVLGSASSLQGAVSGLLPSDVFDRPSQAFDPSGTASIVTNGTVSQQLQIVENGSTYTIALDPKQSFSGDIFQLATDSASGTLITEQAVCFCRGTRILTDRGERAVEDLAVGDRVKTLSGRFEPIVWIGFGRDLVTRANKLARPIIVRQGALADNVPNRDLYLTHGHALYLEDVLIPVEHLVNHSSIAWDETARVVEYYHIELESHEVVFAEGAAAETYYDAHNRALFHNTREGSEAGSDKTTFAPVLHDGEIVGKLWAELYERAGGRFEDDTTDDPDLHLVIDGARLDPLSIEDGVYMFTIEGPSATPLLLRSRSSVPSLLGHSRHEHRQLGVAIRQLILNQPGVMTAFDDQASLFRMGGCHMPEEGYCWTDGELVLYAGLFAHLRGSFTLIVQTQKQGIRYPVCHRALAA